MFTKTKLALALTGSLLLGAVGIAAANGHGDKADFAQKKAEILAKYDTNHDGKLDAQERAVMREERTTEAFKKMDTDGSGQISLDEFKAARGKMFEHARHMRKEWRKGNGSGSGSSQP